MAKTQASQGRPSFEIVIPLSMSGAQTSTSTTYDDMAFARLTFDRTKYVGYKGMYFKAIVDQNAAGSFTTNVQLITNGGTVITGSGLSVSNQAQFAQQSLISSELSANLTNGNDIYRVQAKVAAGGTVGVEWAAIIVRF